MSVYSNMVNIIMFYAALHIAYIPTRHKKTLYICVCVCVCGCVCVHFVNFKKQF